MDSSALYPPHENCVELLEFDAIKTHLNQLKDMFFKLILFLFRERIVCAAHIEIFPLRMVLKTVL